MERKQEDKKIKKNKAMGVKLFCLRSLPGPEPYTTAVQPFEKSHISAVNSLFLIQGII